MRTIIGIKEWQYAEHWYKVNIGCGNKDLLDSCIRFYQALKQERNATNHASENEANHMDYRFTKKAIAVFVEMCRRLKESAEMNEQ